MKKILSVLKTLLLLLAITVIGYPAHAQTLINAQPMASYTTIFNDQKPSQVREIHFLVQVLNEIEFMYHVSFHYNHDLINGLYITDPVPLDSKENKLEDILAKILDPLNLKFLKVGNKIYLIKSKNEEKRSERINDTPRTPDIKDKFNFSSLIKHSGRIKFLPPMQDFTVRGTVTSEAGEPIPGVNIIQKGTTNGTTTDAAGKYSLVVSEGNAVLVFSFIGFKTQEIEVKGGSVIDVALVEDIQRLSEIVVVGYGEQKKEVVTGAITTVQAKDVSLSPAVNLTQGLAGRMPGVIINSRGGRYGRERTEIFIRGKSTINDASPLYVVDGIVRNYEGLDRLNPTEIESITVLKDASGAIYGSQAANGVILVTTKRGTIGKPTIDFSYDHGFSQPARVLKMADSYTYADRVNLGRQLKGLPPLYTAEELQKFKDGSDPINYPNTNWWKMTMREWKNQDRANLAVRGGTDNIKYFLSMGMLYQGDPFIQSFGRNKQHTMRANIDANITENLKVSFDISGRLNNILTPYLNDFGDHMLLGLPVISPVFPNGLYAEARSGNNALIMIREKDYGYDSYDKGLLTNTLNATYKIPWIKGLSLSGSYAYDFNKEYRKQFQGDTYFYRYDEATGEYIQTRVTSRNATPRLYVDFTQGIAQTANARLAFNRTIADNHTIDAFVGYEQNKTHGDILSASRLEYLSGAIHELFAGTSDKDFQNNNGIAWETARQNYFGRVLYDYKSKYMVQFQFRYDGSQNFPKEKRFGFFPGISGGWTISNERFMENVTMLDFLKLRGSWGMMGNDKVAAFQYLTSYTYGSNYVFNGSTAQGLIQSGVPNPNITWESAQTTDIGLEAQLWKGLLGLEVDYFYTKRDNILTKRNATVPGYTGLVLPNENIGSVENRGIELMLSHHNAINNDLNYSVSGNFTYARSNVLYIDEVPPAHRYQKAEGMPIGSSLLYEVIGIFDDQADVDGYPHLPGTMPGDLIRRDANNDGVINSFDIVRQELTPTPQVIYGLNFRVGYKQFELAVMLQGQARARVNGLIGISSLYDPTSFGNFISWFAEDGWTPENPTGTKPRPGLYSSGVGGTTYQLFNGAFLRIKNAELAYNLPKSLLSRAKIQNCRIYLTGYNLISFDALKDLGIDIEMGADMDYLPPDRTINLGVNLTF